MLKEIIEQCFSDIRANKDPSEGKIVFGYIWAVFASKKVKFNDTEICLSWRDLSARLAEIYNEWYDGNFTTDAFLNVVRHEKVLGEDADYDDALMRIYKHDNCRGIFSTMNIAVRSNTEVSPFKEINIVTGEELFYKQSYKHGKPVGAAQRIDGTEFDTLCYSR